MLADLNPLNGGPGLPAGLIPAAAEAWPAVFGGLIPILGLAAIAYVIYRAVRDNDEAATSRRGDASSARGHT